jgi:hypothetical protein
MHACEKEVATLGKEAAARLQLPASTIPIMSIHLRERERERDRKEIGKEESAVAQLNPAAAASLAQATAPREPSLSAQVHLAHKSPPCP